MELQYFIGTYITHDQQVDNKDIYFRIINCDNTTINIHFDDNVYSVSVTEGRDIIDKIITVHIEGDSGWYIIPYAKELKYKYCEKVNGEKVNITIKKYDGIDKENIIIQFINEFLKGIYECIEILQTGMSNTDTTSDKYQENIKTLSCFKLYHFLFRDRINSLRRYLGNNHENYNYSTLLDAKKINSEITLKLHYFTTIYQIDDTKDDVIIEKLKKICINSKIKIKDKRLGEIMFDRIQLNTKYIDKLPIMLREFSKDKELLKLINIYKNNETSYITNSLDLFSDIILMSDWCEELMNNNIMGLLVRISSLDLSKMGYDIRKTIIHDITTTIISYQQLLYAYDIFYTKYHTYDTGLMNSNSATIQGNGIGTGNIIIPIYIHKTHWKLVKIYMNSVLGLCFCLHPLGFSSKHIDIYFLLLSTMVNLTFCDNTTSDKWIHNLINIFRTCYQITIENESIKNKIDTFCDIVENRVSPEYLPLSCFHFKILCSDFMDYRKEDFITCFVEEGIRNCCKELYHNIFGLEKTFVFNTVKDTYDYETSINENNYMDIDKYLNHDNINKFIHDFQREKKVQLFFGDIISIKRFHQTINQLISKSEGLVSFINIIDNYYGAFPDEYIFDIKQKIKSYENVYNYSKVEGLVDNKFSHHEHETNEKLISIEQVFTECNIECNESLVFALLIQSIIQRNDKKRVMAIKNNRYINPFNSPIEVIGKCGLIIARNIRRILEAL